MVKICLNHLVASVDYCSVLSRKFTNLSVWGNGAEALWL